MSRKSRATPPQTKHIFRYWVEIRELATGTVRKLPLTTMRAVCLKRYKKNETPVPDREFLQIKDDAHTIEADTFAELRVQLREKYPDALYERTLHFERDFGRERAWDGLVRLIAERVAEDMLAGTTAGAEAGHSAVKPKRRRSPR